MFDNLFLYFFPAAVVFAILSGIFFALQKKNVTANYKQFDSVELKNISGTIISDNGPLKKNFQWCSFDILINKNSVFIFPRNFYFIPTRLINLIYSNSDKKYTRRPLILRELKVAANSVEIIYYHRYAIMGKRKINLKNLNKEQISIFENIRRNKNY